MSGKKHDEGKPRYDLIPPEAKRAIASQLTYGAKKYGDRNWEKGLHFGRLVRAVEGHLTEWWAGENLDEEGRPHLHGALTSLAMLVASIERFAGTEFDDRPTHSVSNPESDTERLSWAADFLTKHVEHIPTFTEMIQGATLPVRTVITYNPQDFQGVTINQNPPVDSVESSGFEPRCEECNRLIDVGKGCTCKPEETTSPTGETRPRYAHKVHYQTSVFGEIRCDTRNVQRMSDRGSDVTCKRCLAMM